MPVGWYPPHIVHKVLQIIFVLFQGYMLRCYDGACLAGSVVCPKEQSNKFCVLAVHIAEYVLQVRYIRRHLFSESWAFQLQHG